MPPMLPAAAAGPHRRGPGRKKRGPRRLCPRGRLSSGRWRVSGEQICFRQSRPFPYPLSYCTTLVRGGVGTVWSGKAVTGEPIRIELVAGR